MFKEIYGDLFDHTQERTPLHCIASDHAMGAGIAVPMAEKYRLREPMDELDFNPRILKGCDNPNIIIY